MRVQHNIVSMNAYRNYNNNTKQINRNIEKLSSGYTINRAGDDAAGLAISEKMRAQITGLEGAQKNAKDGISLVQTAEGALTEVHSMLNRMYSLAEQSANGTYDENTDRAQLQKEVSALRTEIDRIADSANFNGLKLLDGSMATASIDWGNENAENTLHGYLGVSWLTDNAEDIEAFNDVFVDETGSAMFDVEARLAGDKLDANDSLDIWPIGAFTNNGFSVTVTDSAGNELGLTGDEGATVTFGDSGEAFAYDGDHRLIIDVTKSGEAIGRFAFRFDNNEGGNFYAIFKQRGGLDLQIGDDANSWNIMNVSIGDVHAESLGISYADISEQGSAQVAMNAIKDAINYISDIRGGLGATQNRLDHTINNLSVMQENIQDAESTIRDTDVANEMMKYTKNSILVQSAQAMLAQANQQPQGVLQLLQ